MANIQTRKRPLLWTSIVLTVVFLITAISIVVDGLQDQSRVSDVAVILGSKVNPDGTVSDRLAARLNKGVALYQEGKTKHIIVSGGTDQTGNNEAVVMKQYLVTKGIPENAILEDKQGINTWATARNSARLMHQHHFHSALIVSQYFHLTRSRLAFKRCNIAPVYTAPAEYSEWRDIYSTVREVVGFYYYLLAYHANACT